MTAHRTSQVRCPTCRKRGDWFAGPHGPFCSRRCQLVDLGKWLGEEHCFSQPLDPEPLEKYASLTVEVHSSKPTPD